MKGEINRRHGEGVRVGAGVGVGGRGNFHNIQALELPRCQAGLALGGPHCHGNRPAWQKSPSSPQPVGTQRKSLTVMVFSLLCFLLGDEDPRFWGERQETSSKLFSILDISVFYLGSPKAPMLG